LVTHAASRARVLVVATCRDRFEGDDARTRLLGDLLAASSSASIPLRALSTSDVARLLEEVTGAPAPAPFVARLHEKSGGNPLHLQELLKTEWAERAASMPEGAASLSTDLHHGMRQAIAMHLDGISAPCRALRFSVRAAELATARAAHGEAATRYERAVEALRHLRPEDTRRLDVHLALARSWHRAGEIDRARAAYLDATTLARAFRDP